MSDIVLWQWLQGEPSPSPHDWLPLIPEVSTLPLEARAPFLGYLQPYLRHDDPSVRATTFSMFRGATGYPAWKEFLRGLNDPEAQVRYAVLEALKESAQHDPHRWMHVLLHPQADVRAWGLQHLPDNFPQHLCLYLLSDPTQHGRVSELLETMVTPPEQTLLLLDYLDQHQLSAPQALRMLTNIPWQRQGNRYFEQLGQTRVLSDWPETPEALELAVTHPLLREDPLDRINSLLWQGQESDNPTHQQQSQSVWDDWTYRWNRGYMTRETLKRIGVSLAVVGFREWDWQAQPLALCARSLPCILMHPSIPLTVRRQAVAQTQPSQEACYIAQEIATLLESDLCRYDDGLLHLATVGRLLRLVPSLPYKLLLEHVDEELVLQSLLQHPECGPDFLSLPAQNRTEKAFYNLLLQTYVKATQHNHLERLGDLTLQVPVDCLSFLKSLSDEPFALRQTLLKYLLDQTHPAVREVSEKKLDRLAQALLDLFPPTELTDLLRTLTKSMESTLLEALQEVSPSLEAPEKEDSTGSSETLRQSWQGMEGQELRTQLLQIPLLPPLVLNILGYVGRRHNKDELGQAVSKLSFVEMASLFALEQQSILFPYEQEQELFQQLRNQNSPQLQALAGPDPKSSLKTSRRTQPSSLGQRKRLSPEQSERWSQASNAELAKQLWDHMPQSLEGLCKVLSRHNSLPEDPVVALALLLSADSYEEVALALHRLELMHPRLLSQLDSTLLAQCERMKNLPLMATAWLYRWDRHHDAFVRVLQSEQEDILQALQWSLGLASPSLLLRFWKAIQRWVNRWRWHHKDELEPLCPSELSTFLVDMLLPPHHRHAARLDKPPDWVARAVELPVQEQVAHILTVLDALGWHHEQMTLQKQRLLPFLPSLPPELRSALQRWLPVDGNVQQSKASRASFEIASSSLLQKLRQTFIAHKLKEHCYDDRRVVVEEAVSQLVTLEEEGISVLLRIILEDDPPHLRCLTDTIALWDHEESLAQLRQAVSTFSHDPERQFLIAAGLCERGEDSCWSFVHDALHHTVEEDWFLADDWLQLERLSLPVEDVAIQLVRSPLYGVYSRAIHHLLKDRSVWNERYEQALVAFLECGFHRLPMLRRRVARRLHQHQSWQGFPLLFTDALKEREGQPDTIAGENAWKSLWAEAAPELVKATVQASLLAGTPSVSLKRAMICLRHSDVPKSAQQQALLQILRTSYKANDQQQALQHLQPTTRRSGLLQKLAQAFAWGIQRGRELTGKIFRIEMIGGQDFGYTRLNEARIFVNPLPLLREVQHGDRILKGLILHEIGHHIYHSDPESQKLWKQAQKEGLGKILNLVADEQLERSLRAKDPTFGNDLKRLAAFAFQHNDREMHIGQLLLLLRTQGFAVLSQTPLRPARRPGHVVLSLGKLFYELENQGFSFPRFVRALRMGLGNRHDDPKVDQALKLFTKSFRNADMARMLDISRQLRDIFHNEIPLLAALSQDGLWSEQNNSEITAKGEGITAGELQGEVERILRGRPKSKKDPTAERVINLSDEESFSLIHNIVPLVHNPSEHRQYKLRVARWSGKMRDHFRRLGLGTVPQRRRLSGYRLSTPGLSNSLLRGDPRILMSRKTVFKTDLFVGILVDCSGSMSFNENLERAKLFAALLAEAAASLTGVDARFFGFTDTTIFDAGTAQQCAVHALELGGGNNDAAALWHAAQIAVRSRRQAKLLVMISDGAPTECSVTALRALVKNITERMKICCAQVAVHPLEEICFPHYIEVTDDQLDLAIPRFGKILAQLVRRALQG
ncbi:MAG: hypothetical protein EP343_18055 [Deltaproteobacteria bacterium]|nr:MAG: hypothetical protein EP343_18055 [Deltaproteobacteria bacterium]